jgi:tetratricopeptide (TPR) repeat protein
MWGYDAWGHVAYVIFLDIYRSVPWADQGWSYFHPPLHYALGWLLAQAGSGEILMRGLPLLGSAASLGTAALAAWLVRRATPDRPALALLAFGAVALLPVHLFLSAMPGNELTETFLTAAAISLFVANERRAGSSLAVDAATGLVIALALLTKFSGLLPLLVVGASLALRPLLAGAAPGDLRRAAGRAALIAGIALALPAPYYARNVATFGTPFQLSRDFALVSQVERDQPPGVRRLADYVSFSPRIFSDPNPLAPHMLRSVWGTVYVNVWADVYRESDVARALEAERGRRRSTTAMALLGLLPTGLALAGAVLATRDLRRGRRRAVYLPLLILSAAALGVFALFAWQVAIWSALKSSYLLGLSLPFGVFLARSVEALAARPQAGWRVAAVAALALVGGAAALVGASGVVLPRRTDAPATGAVRFYFGELDGARAVYGRLTEGAAYPVPWIENLAAVELADGRPDRARRLYARAVASALPVAGGHALRRGRLAVASALDGDAQAALRILDEALAEEVVPELLANRGALRAAAGDLGAAEADLRAALEAAPEIAPAWRNLARVLAQDGRADAAAGAREGFARAACRGPRGYPYGVGTGEVLEWGVGRRPLLLLEAEGVRVAPPAFYRRACAEGGAG